MSPCVSSNKNVNTAISVSDNEDLFQSLLYISIKVVNLSCSEFTLELDDWVFVVLDKHTDSEFVLNNHCSQQPSIIINGNVNIGSQYQPPVITSVFNPLLNVPIYLNQAFGLYNSNCILPTNNFSFYWDLHNQIMNTNPNDLYNLPPKLDDNTNNINVSEPSNKKQRLHWLYLIL